jgi:carbon starvation protein
MVLIMILGIISIFILHPSINAPQYISGTFPLWPILFITIACGAISGFHGLVASGTTSKQLEKESHGRSVGYGGMLLEGLLAVFVTLVVVAGVEWGSGVGQFHAILDQGWIVLFSSGFGNIVGQVMPFLTIGVAGLLGAFMVNQFILTSVDTSTRISRFLMTETLIPKLNNKVIATLITLIPAYLLAITNSYEKLWRLFGTSNQMIAAITLIGVSSYFIMKKVKTKFITIPAIFVLITTLSALVYLSIFPGGYLSQQNYELIIISGIMFILGVYIAFEGFKKLFKKNS